MSKPSAPKTPGQLAVQAGLDAHAKAQGSKSGPPGSGAAKSARVAGPKGGVFTMEHATGRKAYAKR